MKPKTKPQTKPPPPPIQVEALTGKNTHYISHYAWQTGGAFPRALCGNKAPANGWIRLEQPTNTNKPICKKCQAAATKYGFIP